MEYLCRKEFFDYEEYQKEHNQESEFIQTKDEQELNPYLIDLKIKHHRIKILKKVQHLINEGKCRKT